MPRYYIESFDADDCMILGNLDGQAALGEPRNPLRCHAWRHLGTYRRPRFSRAARWQLVTAEGHVVARKRNPFHLDQKEPAQ